MFTFSNKRFSIIRFLPAIVLLTFNVPVQLTQPNQSPRFMSSPVSLFFVNENTGFVCGEDTAGGFIHARGEIRKTTDGGVTWSILTIPTISRIGGIFFVDHLYGIVSGFSSVILKTTDGGNSWSDISYHISHILSSVNFVNKDTGFIAGGGLFEPIFLKTTNAGINWISLPVNMDYDLSEVDFFDVNYGLVAGNRTILRTTNGGQTVEVYFYDEYYLGGLSIAGPNTAYACGGLTNGGAVIIKSENSGINWSSVYSKLTPPLLLTIKFLTPGFGLAAGENGIVLRTVNGGETWEEQFLPGTPDLVDIFFINPNTGWITGRKNLNGYLYKTTNAGVTWTLLTRLPLATDYKLYQNFPNPFNQGTKIVYELRKYSQVLLKIYDVLGREVETLADDKQEAGQYEYFFAGRNFASGIYFYKLSIVTINTPNIYNYSESGKMVLIK